MQYLILLALVLQISLAFPVDNDNHRIVGGQPAYHGQFPHQVSLELNGQHVCGGSIISPTTILTAAHCVHGMSGRMFVRAGIIDLYENGVRVPIYQIIMHSNYDPYTTLNDVALLRLSSALSIVGNIRIAPLRFESVRPGETLTLSGWGITSYPGNLPSRLMWTSLTGIDLRTCSQNLNGANPIGAGHVCTSSPPNQGACQGDSGGPLIDSQGAQIGVVSWGVPCAKGYPDVFTSVPYYVGWILQNAEDVKIVDS